MSKTDTEMSTVFKTDISVSQSYQGFQKISVEMSIFSRKTQKKIKEYYEKERENRARPARVHVRVYTKIILHLQHKIARRIERYLDWYDKKVRQVEGSFYERLLSKKNNAKFASK